jgi:anaerobic magnesium-protoporphyrin IX monomethyl ester cyclase
MRILLINPPWVTRKGNVWNNIACVMPPLGLGWMAAALERHGHNVTILDAHAERIPFDRLPSYLRQSSRFDLVGITATTALIFNAIHIAQLVKAHWPETLVVLGGVHPTVLPEEALADPAVDVVVRGEGENTLLDLADGKPLETIPGVSYRPDKNVYKHNPDRELIHDLDSLGIPAYHLLPMDKYYPSAGAAKRLPATSVLATRGCPGRCTFCYRIFGSKLRVREGYKVAEEVKYLQDRYGFREICFYDDTFTAFKKEVRAFCLGLEEMNVDLTWVCFSRVDTVDEDLLRMMKEAGCHQIMYGIESACPEILRNIGKRADTAQAEHAVRLTQKVGIDVRAAFMLGNPGETEDTMQQTLDLAIRLNPDIALFNVTTPFPGTDMFDWADKNGCLLTKDWRQYDLSHPIMALPTVSPEVIQEFYQKAFRRFFLRPAYLARRAARLRTLTDFSNAWRGLKAVANL